MKMNLPTIKSSIYRKILSFIYLSYKHSTSMKCKQNNTSKIKKKDIILFSTLRNEGFRIEHFLKYYRQLGINHFIFVDNGSTDNFAEIVKDQEDCSVWYTNASYKKSNFGMHWLNYLLRKYGSGHWCLTVDPDELLIFPYCEQRNLQELTEFLDNEKRENFFCLMLDMYGKGRISDAHCESGQNPLEVTPYFDPDGYVQRPNPQTWDVFIQGGPRRRVIFKDNPDKAPAVNKTPLIKWQWHYNYVSSMHCALPNRLNRPHPKDHLAPTGCLLHFKFLSILEEKAKEEINRKEHYDNSIEYKKYSNFIDDAGDDLFYSESVKFENSTQLIQLGLMNNGQWF